MNNQYRIGDVFDLIGGGTPTTKQKEYWGEGTPWFSSADIDNAGNLNYRRCVTPLGLQRSATNVVPKGTIVVVTRVGLGKVVQITEPMCFSQDMQALLPKKKDLEYNHRFLFYQLSFMMQSYKFKGQGTTISGITKKQLADALIYLPDMEKQDRIVSRIEELFSQLDATEATLRTVKEQLAVYRQAVLSEAFTSVISESESCFVEDICKEIKVGIVIKPAQYYTTAEKGIKAFRSANVREFFVNDSDWVYLTKEGHQANSRSEIHTGDVLVVRSGYPGTACVVSEQYDGCNAIDIMIAVPDTSKVLPEYLCAYTNSPLGRKIVQEKKRGVAQAHFNVGGFSKTPVIIPSIKKQREVLNYLDSKLSAHKNIEQTIVASLHKLQVLRQSILKLSFKTNDFER